MQKLRAATPHWRPQILNWKSGASACGGCRRPGGDGRNGAPGDDFVGGSLVGGLRGDDFLGEDLLEVGSGGDNGCGEPMNRWQRRQQPTR